MQQLNLKNKATHNKFYTVYHPDGQLGQQVHDWNVKSFTTTTLNNINPLK